MAWRSRSQFQPIRILAENTFGRVVLAREKKCACQYTIKEANLTEIRRKCKDDEKMAERCLEMVTEQGSTVMANEHPNIVRVFGFFTDLYLEAELYHMVMEYCDGGNLESVIREGVYFDEPFIMSWLEQIVSAVQFLHSKEIIHRHIKTSSIFLFENRRIVKLGDFGPTKGLTETTLTSIANLPYLAPELINDGKPCSFASDTWAVGIVAFRSATLKFPFDGNATLLQTRRPLPALPERYSRQLADFIEMLVQLDPNKRLSMSAAIKLSFFNAKTDNKMAIAKANKQMALEKKGPLFKKMTFEKRYMAELFQAAQDGKLEEIETLLNKGADINAKIRNDRLYRCTALHLASENGQNDAVSLLLRKGADVNAKDRKGLTALYYAARHGHKYAAGSLIASGASVNSSGNHGKAGKPCVQNGFLVTQTAAGDARVEKWTVLHEAVLWGHLAIAALLVETGADVNSKSSSGKTPLHYAALYGHRDVAEFLITKGADIQSKDKKSMTPLQYAIVWGHPDVAALLTETSASK